MKPAVGYETGTPTASGPGQATLHDREEYYKTTHLQAIKFEITHRIVTALEEVQKTEPKQIGLIARHRLFPQVFTIVESYVETKVGFRGCHPCELGQEKYVTRIVERLIAAIEPNKTEGEIPLTPILNRYKPIGTSADVNFLTTRPCYGTHRSQINQVVLDTQTWERAACFGLEQSEAVACYVRNDHLGFSIPYEYTGVLHNYEPDFIVRLKNGMHLVLEIKGYETEQDRAKHASAGRWLSAVNNWGGLGKWGFHVCKDPQLLREELATFQHGNNS